MAMRERFVLPHYHAYVRENRGCERRVCFPEGPLDKEFVADPFLLRWKGETWMFFEGLYVKRGNRGLEKGVIGCLKQDGQDWRYCGVALEEPWHLSFPQVLEEHGRLFMIPESGQAGTVSLYECAEFPLKWIKRCDLLKGNCNYVDAAILRENGMYYMVLTPADLPRRPELWLAESILGPWRKHPESDNVSCSAALRRNGGAFIRRNGRLYRIAQDCDGGYGIRLSQVPIQMVDKHHYQEGAAEDLETSVSWPQPMPYHTYNRLAWNDVEIEVVDRHYYTLKSGMAFCSSLFWFLVDGLMFCCRRLLSRGGA